jgi:nucleoid-associated protein YgaU
MQNAVTMGDGITRGLDALIAQSGVDLSQYMPANSGSGMDMPAASAASPFNGSGSLEQSPSTGNPLILPTVVPAPTSVPAAPTPGIAPSNQMQAAAANGGAVSYVVQPGDSMYKIAEKMLGNGNLVADLCAANGMNMAQCGTIRRGQTIKLTFDGGTPPRERPVVAQQNSGQQMFAQQQAKYNPAVTNKFVAPVATTSNAQSYTIQAGDSIYKIAQKAGDMGKVYDICRLNRQSLGDNCDQLSPGTTITLP